MAAKQKSRTSAAKQRDIFGEMMEGVAAMKAHREGKITLRTFTMEPQSLPEVDAELRVTRRKRSSRIKAAQR